MTQGAVSIFVMATEESGDRLGASLMRELKSRLGGKVHFSGVGGNAMQAEGLVSLFPIEQLSIVGVVAVLGKLPMILRLIRQTVDAALAARPDIVIAIDSPDFTLRVARRIHAADPIMKIVDYVSPSVWAWRPGRAKAMRRYVDHILALLPFEPDAHHRLGGPPCSYVGHPLIEQLASLRPNGEERARRDASPPVLLVLPGSRRSEIRHHMAIFGETLRRLRAGDVDFELILPTMPHLLDAVREAIVAWPIQPRIVVGEDAKRAAFRIAHAALAKSGTVTLELALSGVPMVGAYRMGAFETAIGKYVVSVPTVILANLVAGENVVPEFLLRDCTAENLAPALRDIIADTPARQRQLDAFANLDVIMEAGGRSPSEKAADIVLKLLERSGMAGS